MTMYVINMMYNILTVFCGYLLTIGMFTQGFIQHTVSPFVACAFQCFFSGLVYVFDYSYSVIMTIVHNLTVVMLRVIDTLPATVQPLAADALYYGSDIITMVISVVFSMLRWTAMLTMEVTILLVTTTAFWAILLAVMILSCLYYYYIEYWCVTARAIVEEGREERNERLQPVKEQQSTIVTTCRDETDSAERKIGEEMLCVVCQHEEKTILLQPCNHLCLCAKCIDPVLRPNRMCPVCRRHVRQWIKIYW